jgi:hypothetical protein
VSIVSLISIDKYREYSHGRDFANIEHNHQFVGTDPDAYYAVVRPSENIRTAFTALESSFSNPNDFKLSSFSTQKKDTVYDTHSDTVRYIFFTYQVKGQAERFACVRVFNNKATIETLAGDPATDAIYQPVKEQFKRDKQETLESVKEATRLLEDSIRRRKEAAAKKTLAE